METVKKYTNKKHGLTIQLNRNKQGQLYGRITQGKRLEHITEPFDYETQGQHWFNDAKLALKKD